MSPATAMPPPPPPPPSSALRPSLPPPSSTPPIEKVSPQKSDLESRRRRRWRRRQTRGDRGLKRDLISDRTQRRSTEFSRGTGTDRRWEGRREGGREEGGSSDPIILWLDPKTSIALLSPPSLSPPLLLSVSSLRMLRGERSVSCAADDDPPIDDGQPSLASQRHGPFERTQK